MSSGGFCPLCYTGHLLWGIVRSQSAGVQQVAEVRGRIKRTLIELVPGHWVAGLTGTVSHTLLVPKPGPVTLLFF